MGTITLKNVRTTSDVTMNTSLKDGGVYIDWSELADIKAWLWSDAQKALAGRCDVRVDTDNPTNLICEYASTKAQYPGINRLVVQATYMGETKTYDKPAFNFVRWTAGLTGEQVTINDPDVDVAIEVTDVSSSILQRVISAALAAAAHAEHAASLVPLQVLQDCEQATIEANQARDDADAAAEHATPYIGGNGNWWRWSKEAGEYVDTGEVAQGPTGNGIQSVEQTTESQESEGENVVTVTMTDGTQAQFTIRNGKQGERGLQGIPGVANAKYKQVETLPEASAETLDFIYLTPAQTAGVYDMSYTEQDGNTYTWKPLGSTAIQLSDYATKQEVTQLEHEISDLDISRTNSILTVDKKYISGLDGTEVANNYRSCTDFIPVLFGSVLSFSAYGSASPQGYALYDSSKQFVSGESIVAGLVDRQLTVPDNVAYIRITFVRSDSSSYGSFYFKEERVGIKGIKDAIRDKADISYGKNLYTGVVEDGFLYLDGRIRTSDSYAITDYIPVDPSTAYYASRAEDNPVSAASTYICFYDKNKCFLPGSAITANTKSFTTPAGCYFVRFTINKTHLNSDIQIEKGSSRTTYERGNALFDYLATMPFGSVDKKAVAESSKDAEPVPASDNLPLSGGIVTYGEKNYVRMGCRNLFDGIVEVGFLKADGTTSANSTYRYTVNYIPVKPGASYHLSQDGDSSIGAGTTYLCYYDASKNFVSSELASTQNITIPNGCYYMRTTIAQSKMNKVQIEAGSTRTQYEPYNPIYEYLRPYEASQAKSLLGTNGAKVAADTLAADTSLELTDFPAYCKVKTGATAVAFFSSFTDLYFGKEGRHGLCLKIDATNVYFIVDLGLETESISATVPHGLTISNFLKVSVYQTAYSTFRIILFTEGGLKVIDTESHYDFSGTWSVKSSGALTDVQLVATCGAFRCPVWCFGDSYFGEYPNRIGGVLRDFGFKNVYWANLLGGHGYHLQPDFALALNFGTPKYAVWGIGQNDADSDSEINSSWQTYTNRFIALCQEKGIIPILCTIPNVSGDGSLRNHSFKNAWIKASGYRYIDTEAAVGAQSDGTWYPGMLAADEVHPTQLGAQAIATQWLVDFPEIMEYGMLNEELPTD